MPSPFQQLAWRRAGRALLVVLVVLVVCGAPLSGGAQSPDDASADAKLPAYEPGKSVRAVFTDVAPVIDGVLDEAEWQRAGRIDELRQRDPVQGADPAEPTRVMILFDHDFLYIGVRAYDRHPDQIAATKLRRDSDMQTEDSIFVLLDTFWDHRNAYFFQVSAIGMKRDALIEDNRRFLGDWNGIWYARARIDEHGWAAELAIPFKTVSFDPNQTTWGFNVHRRLRHLNEELQWANVDQNFSTLDVSRVGVIEGLEGLEQGLGLDVKPALPLIWSRNEKDNASLQARPGGDIIYKITPSLTGVATINTDFSEAAVDDVQLNVTRFNLFFPETRDFFLQDQGIFEFGGLTRESGLPFFSRRIGLDGDEVVNLRWGGKATGRIGGWNVGALGVRMESYTPDDLTPPEKIDRKDLFVGRAAYNILEESSVGMIVTGGDPNTNDDNVLGGVDLRYRDSSFRGWERSLTADLWYQHSYTTDTDGNRENALGATLAYPNDKWNWRARYQRFDDNYNPALGFVTRLSVKRYDGRLRYRYRPGNWIRTVDSQIDSTLFTDLGNSLESGQLLFDLLDVRNDPGDRVRLRYSYRREVLDDDQTFDIADEVFLDTGSYTTHRGSILFEAGQSRPIGGALEFGYGGFFDGRRTDAIVRLDLRPSPQLNLSLEYEWRYLDDVGERILDPDSDPPTTVPGEPGNATLRLGRARLVLNASPRLSWSTVVQYVNSEDSIEINSRLRWILQPGNELFLVVNQSYDTEGGGMAPVETELVSKVVYTFRF